MNKVVTLAALALLPLATRGFAADGQVPAAVLQRLGLGGMQALSDEDGIGVRGLGGNAMARGLSLSTGLVIDRSTNSFVSGNDANAAIASAENAGFLHWTRALTSQQSAFNLKLEVAGANGPFTGVLIGGAGGSACAAAR